MRSPKKYAVVSSLQLFKPCGPMSKTSGGLSPINVETRSQTEVTWLAAFSSVTPPPSAPTPNMKVRS